jgi:hypothetical protein
MHPIRPLERIFIWLGGYTPRNLEIDSPQDREPVSKLGATVLFAMVVAAINWAVGGWTFASAAEGAHRYWAAGATAFLGMFLVLVFDRGLVYVIDTSGQIARLRLATFTVFRFVMVVAISSLTSQAVIPLLLGNELNIKALQMQESAEQHRVGALRSQFQLGTREAASEQASKEVDRLNQASKNLPADIANHLSSARQCWQDYNVGRRNLVSRGVSPSDAREQLRNKATQCSQAEKAAKAEQAAYVQRTRQQLEQATEARTTLNEELQTARSTITGRVDAARQVESANLNARSSAVLWELLTSNPGAMGKWLLITMVLLMCELLPLLYKLQMGQTPPGRRIASENHIKQRRLESDVLQQECSLAMQDEVNHVSNAGMKAAMQQPEVRQVFADCFASTLKALAPSEAVNSMMRDLKQRAPDVISFQRQYPQYATVIGQAWRNAIDQTLQILTASSKVNTP